MSKKYWVLLAVVLLSLGLTTGAVFAKGENPFRPVGTRQVSTVQKGGVIETTVTQTFMTIDSQLASPNAATSKIVNRQTVEYSNCAGAATNGSFVYHCYAQSKRTAGSGNYHTEAHAALVPDTQYGTTVFDYTKPLCWKICDKWYGQNVSIPQFFFMAWTQVGHYFRSYV
jgi:hypothetical protein